MACPPPTAPHQSLFSSAQFMCSIREFRSPEGADFSNSDVFDPKGQPSICAKPSQLRAGLGKAIPEGAHDHECEKIRLHLVLCSDGKTILCPASETPRDQGDCHKMCPPSGGGCLGGKVFKVLIFRKYLSRDTELHAKLPAPIGGFQSHHAEAKKTPQAQGQTQTGTEKESAMTTT